MTKPATHVFHRHTHMNAPTAVLGDGCHIIDQNGKRYLDACGGAAVSCLGHSNEEVRAVIKQQVDQIAYAHSSFFTTEPMERLADALVKQAPKGIDKVYFFSGGSEAMEGAIKLAVQYFQEIGKPKKRHIIARWQSYHGNTLGALSAGGNRWRRSQFESLLSQMYHISPCYAYRYQESSETEAQYGLRVANELETKILELGAENVAAFVAEPVVGATMGCVPAVQGYLKRIREICDQYDVLLILDEVMCGMGRTGHYFACDEDGVAPDLMAIAKGLGAGYQPIGALLIAEKIFEAVYKGTGFFQHGHTYIGHATACAAALKVQEIILRDNLLPRVQKMGSLMRAQLKEAVSNHPNVGDIRGRGLFIGVELVADKSTKAPLDSSLKTHAKIKARAFEKGLMCYPMGGTIDGKNGDHVMFAPPFVISESEIAFAVETFAKTLQEILPASSSKSAA